MYLQHFVLPILSLPRWAKRFFVLVVDAALCVLTVWLAYYLRLGEFVALSGNAVWATGVSIVVALPVFVACGLYRAIFRYSGWPALLATGWAVGIYGVFYALIFTIIGVKEVPRTIGLIQPILLLLFVGGSRAFARVWLEGEYKQILKKSARPRVLVYGAGTTGRQLVNLLGGSHEIRVVGFLDDDDRLHGHSLNGQPVYSPDDLESLVPKLQIRDVILAMPKVSRHRRSEILNRIQKLHVSVRTMPNLSDLAQGKLVVSNLRDLDIDDLLGRDPVMPNHVLLSKAVFDKVVLVTGAGGSIGSELCRQILSVGPRKLLLIEQNEFALYKIHQELEEKRGGRQVAIVPLLASVQQYERMCEIMSTWHPATVYHAAAYKHVPLVEHNTAEGIKNNVFGTLRTAQAAAGNGISDFVLVSTDKAVRPTNIMGASKRLAEKVLQALAVNGSGTKFSMVRFGNVLGSSGSVVPKFRQQIRGGGPVTLTHPEVTRYFMTIPEASQLVIQAGAMAKGGDVFVLDMGESVKIIDLARRMIELSGFTVKDEQNPDGDIEIEVRGLRPAEKLYEELLIGGSPEPTAHPSIMKTYEKFPPWEILKGSLDELEIALDSNDAGAIREIMKELVSGYMPDSEIVDWVYLEQMAGNQDLRPSLRATQ